MGTFTAKVLIYSISMRPPEATNSEEPTYMATLLAGVRNISWANKEDLDKVRLFDQDYVKKLGIVSMGKLIAHVACKLGWDGVAKLLPTAILDEHVVSALLKMGTPDSIHRAEAILENRVSGLIMNLPLKERAMLTVKLKVKKGISSLMGSH